MLHLAKGQFKFLEKLAIGKFKFNWNGITAILRLIMVGFSQSAAYGRQTFFLLARLSTVDTTVDLPTMIFRELLTYLGWN